MPLVKRTRATLRSAEFGFFGVCVNTRTHTPRFCGLSCSAGLFVLVTTLSRPLRTSWLIVGTILDNSSHARPGHETKTATTPTAARSIFRRARNRLNVPGLGSRVTARHLELTYPIRLLLLRPLGHRRYREPNGLDGSDLGVRLQIGCPGADQNLAKIAENLQTAQVFGGAAVNFQPPTP